jgi:hypothetical protein
MKRTCFMERLETRTLLANFTATNTADLIADINASNQSPGPDTITLIANRIFTLNEMNNSTSGPTGLPVIAAGEDLTIFGNRSVIERSTDPQTPPFRLFDVAAGASLNLRNLTLRGGLSIGQARGGAIHNLGNLTLTRVQVRNNSALGGTSFTIGRSALGGGIYSEGSLEMHDCIIRNNRVLGGRGRSAGAGFGGGLYLAGGSASLTHVTIVRNSADGGTGVVFRGRGWGIDPRHPPVTRGKGIGGGLYIETDARASLDNFTVSHTRRNQATTAGRNISGTYTLFS